MGRVRNYNEGQSATLTFKFFDEDFAEALPDTVRYRIDCLTSKQQIRDWTTLTAAQTIDIAITPSDNRIINSRNSKERRQLVVETNYGTDTQSVEKAEWTVTNLQGVD